MKKGILFPYCLLPLFLIFRLMTSSAQLQDSIAVQLPNISRTFLDDDTVVFRKNTTGYHIFDSLVANSKLLSHSPQNQLLIKAMQKKGSAIDLTFYLLLSTVVLLGMLKSIFNRYFFNLLRVFFNTSLRQSQLTEQLLQARLPMWLFNMFFSIVAGQCVFFLLHHYHLVSLNQTSFLIILVFFFLLLYAVKSAAVTLIGWVAGYEKDAQLYNFIVTLTNQLLAVILLPLLFFIVFSKGALHQHVLTISYYLIATAFIFRYIRSYSSIRQQMKFSTLHFVFYIVGVEILPLLLIYKFAGQFLRNYL